MDTNETNEPVGGADVTASLDTSEDIAQTVEDSEEATGGNNETEVVENESEAGEEAQELLAGKYKTKEELAEAYKNLESKLGQREENSDLVKELERTTGMNAQQIKSYLSEQQQRQTLEQYQENPVPFLANEVMQLRQERQLEKQENELNQFLSSEEGKPYQELKQDILEDKQYNPRFQNLSFADIARERYGKAIANGQQSAYKKIDTKIMTKSSGSKSAPQKRVTLEDMKGMTSKEMEQFLSPQA